MYMQTQAQKRIIIRKCCNKGWTKTRDNIVGSSTNQKKTTVKKFIDSESRIASIRGNVEGSLGMPVWQDVIESYIQDDCDAWQPLQEALEDVKLAAACLTYRKTEDFQSGETLWEINSGERYLKDAVNMSKVRLESAIHNRLCHELRAQNLISEWQFKEVIDYAKSKMFPLLDEFLKEDVMLENAHSIEEEELF